MDTARARRIAEEMRGKLIGAWKVGSLINSGKSALVVKASKGSSQAALKIFDPELIERFGRETQLGRIHRELTLVGKRHPHLIEILDGGECRSSGHLYIVMSYLTGGNLCEAIPSLEREMIPPILSQLASAAQFLEQLDLAHRDIKPENIALSQDGETATLLDLGVLRPIGLGDLTDQDDHRPFLGTLRYSSPEYLLRKEKDTPDGWRAVTFYQIGAVLHDMIARRPIFMDYSEPYAQLVDAVKTVEPKLDQGDVPSHYRELARRCLVKDPAVRLQLVDWTDFYIADPSHLPLDAYSERIKNRELIAATAVAEKAEVDTSTHELSWNETNELVDLLAGSVITAGIFPPHEVLKRRIGSREVFLEFKFAASQRFATTRPFGVQLRIVAVSNDPLAVEIAVCGVVGADDLEATRDRPWFVVFRGVHELEVIHDRVIVFFYQALDMVQGKVDWPVVGSAWLPLTAAGI